MSEKRRDKRNRILHNGETQRLDGRYRFKYTDSDGREKSVYSWRLDHNDPHPKDKRKDLAENDDLIRKNPFQFELATVIVNDSVIREAVTRKQQREYLRFVQEDRHFCRYYDGIFILFHTGLRISKFCGLTIADIDFKEKRIRVNHQLQRTSQMEYVIEAPKTEKGIRYVPMTEEVVECFRRIIKNRTAPKVEPIIEEYTGFLFLDKNDMPMVALHWEKYMQHILEKYNSIYKVQMPKITPHVCRHTFRSNMAKSELQRVVGE